MMQTDNQPRLRSYYLWFLLVYFLTILAATAITQLAMRYGLAVNSPAIPIEIQVLALIAATFYITIRFARFQKRFFNGPELHKVIIMTTLIAVVFQLITSALLIGSEIYVWKKSANAAQQPILNAYSEILHNPLVILIAVLIVAAIIFLLQTFNFRVLAKMIVKRMNLPKV